MNPPPPGSAAPRRRRLRRLLLAFLALAVVWVAWLYVRIEGQGARDEAQPADAIVVFGAAEYAGRPSPVFRARLDHAYGLFQRGLAPLIITTGGHGDDPHFSEGGVGRDYLAGRGVPERNLIAETQSGDTADSAERVAVILKVNGKRTCLAVSDDYHIFRIKQMLEAQGLTVYGAPRPEARPRSRWDRFTIVLKEVFSYTVWRLHLG
ncbi:MAG: YdcF family protein [Terriglobales bacterium]